MSLFTIQTILSATEKTRKCFWQWMEKHTLLVNELLENIAQHSQFQTWQKNGDISLKEVSCILQRLKNNSKYAALPGRFYTSAEALACNVYKSWFALQKIQNLKRLGKIRWLQAVESEFELVKTTNFEPDEVSAKACEILIAATQQTRQSDQKKSLMGLLLDMHEATQEPLIRRAINHLLINNLQINEKEQDFNALAFRLEQKRVEVERLSEQLQSRLPKGRDVTRERYLKSLCYAISLPELSDDPQKLEEELERWMQQPQITLFKQLPYPVKFGSSGDLRWSLDTAGNIANSSDASLEINGQGSPTGETLQKHSSQQPRSRICLQFKGAKDHTFTLQCHRRQLHIFRQFLTDYQTHKQLLPEKRFSEALFALRSASLIWREEHRKPKPKKKRLSNRENLGNPDSSKPWNNHRLYLHCYVDRRLLTKEGTLLVKEEQEKITLNKLKNTGNIETTGSKGLEVQTAGKNQHQVNYLNREQSKLSRLQNNPSPLRPSSQPYQGQPHIVIGVSFGRREPVAVAVVDVQEKKVLDCQSAKELFNRGATQFISRQGKKEPVIKNGIEKRHVNGGCLRIRSRKKVLWKPYRLIEQLHRQHRLNSQLRVKEQKQDRYRENNSQSNLGLYIDRLIASRIVELALKRQAATIVIPLLKGVQEMIESDIQAQAQHKYPNEQELQKEYAKHYRSTFNPWSYRRLSECIKECATKEGVVVITQKQPSMGSINEKAIDIALSAWKIKT